MRFEKEDHYTEHLLKEGDILVIRTSAGMAFLRVMVGPDVIPYYHPDSYSNDYWWGTLSAGTGSDYKTIQTQGGYSIFYINKKEYIYQVFQGWHTPGLKVYWRFPLSTPTKALRSEIGAPAFSTTSDVNFGWMLKSEESPWDFPTQVGEFFAIYQEEPEFAVFNPTGSRVNPAVTYLINKLQVKAYDPEKPTQLEKIKNVLMGKIKNAREWSPGTQTWQYPKFKETFGVSPVLYDVSTMSVVTATGREVIQL